MISVNSLPTPKVKTSLKYPNTESQIRVIPVDMKEKYCNNHRLFNNMVLIILVNTVALNLLLCL